MITEFCKAVVRYSLVTKRGKTIGVDPNPLLVEHLPAGEEGRKSFEDFIAHLAGGLDKHLRERR